MDRRAVLALLTPLVAGCFGGEAIRRTEAPGGTSTETPTPESTGTATPEPTATTTPEPTETDTPEPTPSADEREAERHLRTARDRIEATVDEYGGAGGLAEVRADADSFVPSDVYVSLVRANAAVNRAAALAATDEQETAAEQLAGVVTFLSRSTAAQASVIAGHDALSAALDALEDGEGDEVGDSLDPMDTAREETERALSHLDSDTDVADVDAVESVDEDDYETKVEQFEAEATALDDAIDPLSTAADGTVLLSTARSRGENGDGDDAADDAADAQERLEEAASTFGNLAGDLPDGATAFEALFESLQEETAALAAAAADVRNEYA